MLSCIIVFHLLSGCIITLWFTLILSPCLKIREFEVDDPFLALSMLFLS
jgi:hypothetical protein